MQKNFIISLFLILSLITGFSSDYKEHIIQKGETIWRLSKEYGIPVDELCKINNIEDITKVKTGTKLKIPATAFTNNKKEESKEEYTIYKIKEGETLWAVSQKFKTNVDELIKINQIKDITTLKSGLEIKIPINKNEKSAQVKSSTEYKVHYLKKGETIWRVSRRYKVSVQQICKINKISNIKSIKQNAKILIPIKVKYLNYELPLEGEVSIFKTSHFYGVHIFTEEDLNERNVSSVDKGEVSYIDSIPGYGLTVFIKHDNGLLSTYSGLEKINIKKGEQVTTDQVIGIAGNLSRYKKYGILFSIQYKGNGLEFDKSRKKFIQSLI
jgi:LysM repeat protein